MPVRDQIGTLLAAYDAAHELAKRRFVQVMEMSPENEAIHLCQWLARSTAHSRQIFPDLTTAVGAESLAGIVDTFDIIRYAILDDGDISFIQTRDHGPKIMFADPSDAWFPKHYAITVNPIHGNLEGAYAGFEITGVLKDAFAFTAAFDARIAAEQARRREVMEKISRGFRGRLTH
jgi:hypothetical protein